MFAPKVAKPQTKATENPTSRLALERSTPAGHRYGRDPIPQALFLQRAIGNQATSRLLAQASRPDREMGLENMAIPREGRGLSRDFSKIPLFSPERVSQAQPSFSSPTARFAGTIQAKLEVGAVDDPLEREADHVAEQVMRMPDAVAVTPPAVTGGGIPGMQRKSTGPQVSSVGPSPASSRITAPPTVHEVLNSPGQPLHPEARAFFEPRFSYDLSTIRVHADDKAAESARAVGAHAYTVANVIVFGSGRYAPEVEAGRRLLAHELAHVVQHRAAPSAPVLRRAPATFGNLYPEDDQGGARIVQLEETDGLWYEIGPKGNRFRARGLYDFVVKEDKVFALKNKARIVIGQDRPGHLTLAGKGRVEYAGQVEFGTKQERGILIEWSNSSGHIAPTGVEERFLDRVPFPRDRFRRVIPQNVPRRGPQLPVFQPETKPRAGGTATQAAGEAERDAASTTGNATRVEQTAAQTERAAAKADQAATAATKTAVKTETSTARRALTSAFELDKIGALDAADFYLQLHAAHFAALEAVSQHAEVAKTLLAHLAEFESGARTLRQRVDRAWRDEATIPGDPLNQGEDAPLTVTMDDIDTVTAVRDAAARVADDAFHAGRELDAILKGWDAATDQATTTADFTRQAVNDATAELDLRFAKEEGGSFRAYLDHARSDAARIESFATSKWRIAKDILETTDIQQLRYNRAKGIQNRERTEAATRATGIENQLSKR